MSQRLDGLLFVGSCLGLLTLIFLTRSAYRLIDPDGIERDAYAHLLFTDDIREAGHRIPEQPTSVATSGGYAYPYLIHWILSFLPRRWLLLIERFFSSLSDLLFAAMLIALYPLGILNSSETLLSLALLLCTPQFVRFDMPHARGLSSRKPGLVLTTLGLLSFSLWWTTGSRVLFTMGIILGALICLTSRFSVQALVFILLGIGLLVNPVFILAIPVSIAVALVLSFGEYWNILSRHLMHLHDYAVSKQFKIRAVQRRRLLRSVRTLLEEIRHRDLVAAAEQVFDNPIIRTVADNPFLVLVIGAAVATVGVGQDLGIESVFLAWLTGGAVAAVLTSLPYLRFMGEGERYLEYVFLPTVIVVAKGWSTYGTWFHVLTGLALLLGFVVITAYVWAYQRYLYEPGEQASWEQIRTRLNQAEPGTVVLQPFGNSRRLAWETDHRVVDFVMNESNATDETNRLYPETYGVVTDDVAWLESEYAPEWIVFNKTVDGYDGGLEPPASDPVVDTDHYELYCFSALNEGDDATSVST